MEIETGRRLTQLCQALRASPNRQKKDAIKAKIDGLVAAAHAHFDAPPTGTAYPGRKLDA